ncbi:MAG: cation:proton antiporter [Gemmatimonadaceae bacterium]|nr:cation:proton antiporter [Gemmatimonadaceae bacterium]
MHFHSPRADVLAMFLLLVVIIAGPLLAGRLKIPGIIGLITGGWLIGGPHGLQLLPNHGDAVLGSLGAIGLLYLMFGAGLELDLDVLSTTRRAAVTFGLTSFLLPQILGAGVSLAVRDAGFAGNRLVATTAGRDGHA